MELIMPFFKKSQSIKTESKVKAHNKLNPLRSNLSYNLEKLQEEMGHSSDLTIHQCKFGGDPEFTIAIVYIDGLIDNQETEHVIKSLKIDSAQLREDLCGENLFEYVKEHILPVIKIKEIDYQEQLIHSLINGYILVLGEGWTQALAGEVSGGVIRSISPPSSQTVVRGPQDSFTETIQINQSLIRRRLKNKNLHVKSLCVGSISQTKVSVMYLNGIANQQIVDELITKLNQIEIDGVLESGYLEAFIEDKTFTPFPTILPTERPDVVAGNILEGRIAILTDNTPVALVVPVTIFSFFQSVEDYYERFGISSFLRIIRYITFFISLVLPSLYVALITYHPGMLPTTLAINLAAQQENIPFPIVIEALIMEIAIEIIREATIRSPRSLSITISIVGAIVLGDVAISAGVVSPGMVMVVAITGIASFATPSYSIAVAARLIRFGLIVLAAGFGMFGVTMGIIFIIAHMNTLCSYGTPYMAPLAPFNVRDQKDTLFRAPLWSLNMRPKSNNPQKRIAYSKRAKTQTNEEDERTIR